MIKRKSPRYQLGNTTRFLLYNLCLGGLELLNGAEEVLNAVVELGDVGLELLILLLELVPLGTDGLGLNLILSDQLLELNKAAKDSRVVGTSVGLAKLAQGGLSGGGALLEGDDLLLHVGVGHWECTNGGCGGGVDRDGGTQTDGV